MIAGEREYQVTRARLAEFEAALMQIDGDPTERHPLYQQALRSGIEGEIAVMQTRLREYELLRSGGYTLIEFDSLPDLAELLVQARKSSGVSRQALAAHVGVDEQQIADFEATNYGGASLAQVQAAADALGLMIHERVLYPFAAAAMEPVARPD